MGVRTLTLTSLALTLGIFAAADPISAQTETQSATVISSSKDLYRHAEDLRSRNEYAQSLKLHLSLAEEGYGPSLHRLGDVYARGYGVNIDLEKAIVFYRRSIDAGQNKSLVSMGRAYRDLADGKAAYTAFQEAADLGLKGAEMQLASGHLKSWFGPLSDPVAGFASMQSIAETGDLKARYELAEAYRVGRGTAAAPQTALPMYQEMVIDGHVKSMLRLARMYNDGTGTEKDINAAIEMYQKAGELGAKDLDVTLAVLLSQTKQYEQAEARLLRAEHSGDLDAPFDLAQAHASGDLGRLSDRDHGVAAMMALVEQGDVQAARFVAGALGDWDRRYRPARDATLTTLQTAVAEGDRYAVEALAIYYREQRRKVEGAAQLHADLLQDHGAKMRSKIYHPEMVHQLFQNHSGTALRAELAQLLQNADAIGYQNGLTQVFRTNKNVYTYMLQEELRKRGYNGVPLTGKMTSNTLRATLDYCRKNNYIDVCQHGPLRSVAVKLIAGSLAAERT